MAEAKAESTLIHSQAVGGARLAIVLHAHLPYVRHPEHPRSLEERWLYEAMLECYLPLLEAFENLERDRVPYALTLTLTPPLVSMLQDPLLKQRFEAHLLRLEQLADAEMKRLYGDTSFAPVATFYRERFAQLRTRWTRIGGDIVGAFRTHWDRGQIDIIACSATHAYLPGLLPVPQALRAQVNLGMLGFERMVGRRARGMWLPECAYQTEFDHVLRDNSVEYTIVDGHALTDGDLTQINPRVLSPGGTLFYGRDKSSSEQVWSREGGYPGDPYYRDFYRDIGFDNQEHDLLGELGPFKQRVMTGLKYHRITGKVDAKAPYQPGVAKERAWSHALDFVNKRVAQASAHATAHARSGTPPIIVAPYDAELFGHWWFEGPWFIEAVFRHLAHQRIVQATTLAADRDSEPAALHQYPRASSWGEGGYGEVWVGHKSAHLWRHVHHASRYAQWLIQQYGEASGLRGNALDQVVRELLLLQSSDWAFILHTGTSTWYAEARVRAHVHRLRHLGYLLGKSTLTPDDVSFIRSVCSRDALMPGLRSSELRGAYV
jgi:1,4-alpha-glucan branching enzyme